jgi:rSAM/selenodomain-associated transferase 2
MLSIVIPTLNAEATLARTLAPLEAAPSLGEILVVDGGSTDRTVEIARASGATVLVAPRGRGGQIAAGVAAAKGAWLLLLHADTVLADDWRREAADFMAAPANQERAAAFRFALDDPSPAARRLEAAVAWRCRVLGLPYGDQGLLIGRVFLDSIGGMRPLALMEDVDLSRRIGKARLTLFQSRAVTSAARYRDGYLRRSAHNLVCLALYFAGVPTPWIARLYG